jgi:hypothetical protein
MIWPAPIAIARRRVDRPMKPDDRRGCSGPANTAMTSANDDPALEGFWWMKECDGRKGSHALSRRCFWRARDILHAISDGGRDGGEASATPRRNSTMTPARTGGRQDAEAELRLD